MNTEKALTHAKNILARKEHLLTKYPQLYSLKLDISAWKSRVEEFESQLKEESHGTQTTDEIHTL